MKYQRLKNEPNFMCEKGIFSQTSHIGVKAIPKALFRTEAVSKSSVVVFPSGLLILDTICLTFVLL